MAHLAFHSFICRSDNYGVLLHDHKSGLTATIDAPDAAEIERQLAGRGWQLTHIFTTHHHSDHVDGNLALKQKFGCTVIGPAEEADRIPGLDTAVSGGDSFPWAGRGVQVMSCPGHTKGHIAFHLASEQVVFAGDTLFSLGCGRVFEGTLEEMFSSVSQFKTLDPSTSLYCGHEYTQSNAVDRLRAEGKPACPSTIGEELLTNPFLRTGSLEIRQKLGLEGAADVEVFAELRRRKDSFR
jgi:hydroxyacylglutathione hydrolase